MGGVCGTHGGEERGTYRVLVGMDWIYLAEDRDRWRALASAVMNLQR
jgi:hypothetical protein